MLGSDPYGDTVGNTALHFDVHPNYSRTKNNMAIKHSFHTPGLRVTYEPRRLEPPAGMTLDFKCGFTTLITGIMDADAIDVELMEQAIHMAVTFIIDYSENKRYKYQVK